MAVKKPIIIRLGNRTLTQRALSDTIQQKNKRLNTHFLADLAFLADMNWIWNNKENSRILPSYVDT